MTEHFTPNTEQIRVSYIGHRDSTVFYSPTVEQQRRYEAGGRAGGEFDRWLAAHDDEVRAAVQPPTREQIAEALYRFSGDWQLYRIPWRRQTHEGLRKALLDRADGVLALLQQPTPEQECGVCGRRYPASDPRGTCPVCWPGFGEHGQQPTPSAINLRDKNWRSPLAIPGHDATCNTQTIQGVGCDCKLSRPTPSAGPHIDRVPVPRAWLERLMPTLHKHADAAMIETADRALDGTIARGGAPDA